MNFIDKIKEINEDYNLVDFLTNKEKWQIFFERTGVIFLSLLMASFFWSYALSFVVAPFYSSATDKLLIINKYETEGETTVKSVTQGIQSILDEGLITNFVGVRNWIDNRENEQIGKLEIYRVAVNALENNLCRNRGTGGANHNLVQARADIYADYELPWFTSYTTRAKNAISNMNEYVEELKKDSTTTMQDKKAVFIVNSDNLAEVLEKLKQQLQTNLAPRELGFTEQDDRFFKIRGNLIAIHQFLQGIDHDFKDKMIDKSSYEENFIPIIQSIERAVSKTPFIVTEYFGHVSVIEKEANVISLKLGELRDKLKKG